MQNNTNAHQTLRRLLLVGKPFWVSKQKYRAMGLLFSVVLLLFGVAGINVYVSAIAGKFMTALQARDVSHYYSYLLIYAGALVAGTPIIVYYQYLRTKLALVWRKWLTQHLVSRYFSNRAYYRLSDDNSIDNPDERLSQDVETFCNSAVGLFIAVLDSSITVITFIGVLWSISLTLTAAVVIYSLFGCFVTVWIGNKLVELNFQHIKLEADLRYSMADVRRDVESIAFYGGERNAKLDILKRMVAAIRNLELMMVLNRNLTIFTSNFNFMVILIPAAITAPLYFSGQMQFGTITQAGMAFAQVFAGMTLLVAQYNGISGFVANINRLGSFVEVLDRYAAPQLPSAKRIESVLGNSDKLELRNVSVLTPDAARTLISDLSLTVPAGESIIIMGPSGSGKSSLLRVIAGIWTMGQGVVERPQRQDMMFLPQRPFVPRSTLRQAMCYPRTHTCAVDAQLLSVLKLVNLSELAIRSGGLDVEQDWRQKLSLGEQQRLTMARLIMARPKYAFLDEATSALDPENEQLLYNLVKGVGATVISVGHRPSLAQHHHKVLQLTGDGGWSLKDVGSV